MSSVRVGVGALYVRRRPRVRVEAIQSGGGQERGMRSGTVPAPLAVGLGAACELAKVEMDVSNIVSYLKVITFDLIYIIFCSTTTNILNLYQII